MYFVFVATSFLSAFLLFQIQPLISKYLLPFFGGSSSVWVVALLTFQTLLVLGYLYGLFITKFSLRILLAVHLVVIFSIVLFQFAVSQEWYSYVLPANLSWISSFSPELGLIFYILAGVGVLYILLSSTTNVLQSVFFKIRNKDPYFLYRASNLGSLLGLLTYPLLLEPNFLLKNQGLLWFAGFLLFAGLTAFITLRFNKEASKIKVVKNKTVEKSKIGNKRILLWIGLSFLPTATMLAFSNNFSKSIAPIPFLWVIPLSLYLLSFIYGFKNFGERKWILYFLTFLTVAVAGILKVVENAGLFLFYPQLLFFSLAIYLTGLILINKLYELRPVAEKLSFYYLIISVGGAFGGIFVGLAAPLLFRENPEVEILLFVNLIIAGKMLGNYDRTGRFVPFANFTLRAILTVYLVVLYAFTYISTHRNVVFADRNFYGTVKVLSNGEGKSLYNGRILHGFEFNDNNYAATTYYSEFSGVGLAINNLKKEKPDNRKDIGVVGLGVGTMASYCDESTKLTFYEIDAKVITAAEDYFRFLAKCKDTLVVLGDARLRLQEESKFDTERYDILAIDAFSDDSIPIHLLTKEAVGLYLSRIKDDGIIAFHISNRYLDLARPIKVIADEFNLDFLFVKSRPNESKYIVASDWVILKKGMIDLNAEAKEGLELIRKEEVKGVNLWTDDFSSILPVLRKGAI